MTTLKEDLVFGTTSEEKNQTNLESIFNKKLIYRGKFSAFDFDDGATFFVELKTRRIRHDQYPTALIGANKVEIARNNPTRTYWFVFSYIDGMYGIQYSKEFDSFEHTDYSRGNREDYHNRPQHTYFIPYKLLNKLF
jgi:hypothetical protein